ncbi:DUF4919 domain-containing protein [Tessaracoccus sp. OH4464_COT-324]|uniref:DUF4919 domain-containing protein n=1 Tax=Tessaracoccus sp. OH4464_COT-324 TaxID=2491059 RepID=UPI000F63825F|nr:DUF4919 domain-containing protein [Tessaracoccus sp. OH4464_COT-324]RRD45609.1 DUF4919 domain-containing protein [Tessaracoccus sp. OH4464_COT-324]
MIFRSALAAAPDDLAIAEADALIRTGRFLAAYDRILRAMPRWILSPSAHNYLALCHQGLGDEARAASERALSGLALETILRSGEGTEGRPWRVLRVADEYDIAAQQGKRVVTQAMVSPGLDRLEADDGTVLWFKLIETSEVDDG